MLHGQQGARLHVSAGREAEWLGTDDGHIGVRQPLTLRFAVVIYYTSAVLGARPWQCTPQNGL